jgi:drug/metabolite transporter (DMT)-like permease
VVLYLSAMTVTAREPQETHASDAVRTARPGFGATDLMLVSMAAIWGINLSVVKYGTRVMPPTVYNGLRVTLAALALGAFTLATRERRPTRRDAAALLLLGLLGNGAYQLIFIEGLARTRAGNAALVLAASPALVALIGWLRGVERTSARGIVGIALSLAGMTLVVLAGAGVSAGTSTLRGDLLVLVACLCWAAFTVLLKPYTDRVHGMHLAALTMASGAVLQLAFAIPNFGVTPWHDVGPLAWLAVAYSGLGALGLAYYFWYRGVRLLGPTRTAMYSNVQPIVALLVAWPLLGEVPTIWQVAGVVSIISGVLLTRA